MPDARTGQLHLIQDLSEYIQSSSYHFEEAKYQDIPNFQNYRKQKILKLFQE